MARKSSSAQPTVTRCPTCGSERIRRLSTDYRTKVCDQEVVVPSLDREECPDCGEVLLGPLAMRRIGQFRHLAAASE